MLKVFLGGEGQNELGTRGQSPPGDDAGVLETLLRRVRPLGWQVDGAQPWRSIRKYRAGRGGEHNDAHNVRGLALLAYERACELLAFVRDADGDPLREQAIADAVSTIPELRFAEGFGYELAIVAGVARPNLEAWILCLRGRANTDAMSVSNIKRGLTDEGLELKATADYVAQAEKCSLPVGEGSLADWLRRA
jgi:hypothetical protein